MIVRMSYVKTGAVVSFMWSEWNRLFISLDNCNQFLAGNHDQEINEFGWKCKSVRFPCWFSSLPEYFDGSTMAPLSIEFTVPERAFPCWLLARFTRPDICENERQSRVTHSRQWGGEHVPNSLVEVLFPQAHKECLSNKDWWYIVSVPLNINWLLLLLFFSRNKWGRRGGNHKGNC